MKRMNPLWRDTPTKNMNEVDTDAERAISWICDPKNWTSFKSEHSSFAIGSPSVEMFVKAYNLYGRGLSDWSPVACKIMHDVGYEVDFEGRNCWSSSVNPVEPLNSGPHNIFVGDGFMWLSSVSCDGLNYCLTVSPSYGMGRSASYLDFYLCPITPLDR